MSLGQNDNAILKLLADEQLRKENAALAAENEALVQQGIRDHGDWRSKLNFLEADYKAEVARLTAEVEWLRKADRLVCWNAETQAWEVRFEAPK